ncbi:putative bifunctional diguanylate cyclase/phosphodiesterase [Paucibacter sp. JuS9]|uniref:putative bifunctional diguanylate cyclase/phosphodiesterase n=1 Tax=Paucibacter sp. JuS9 TaxID=3228748 RepID=UPI0037576BDC
MSSGRSLPWEQVVHLLGLIPDGVLIIDEQGCIITANEALLNLAGYTLDELGGQPLAMLLPPLARPGHQAQIERFFAAPQGRAMGRIPDLNLWHREGHAVAVGISLGMVRRGEDALALAVVRDMRELRAMHERMQYLAMHDELTGLYSRHMFGEMLSQSLVQSRRSGQTLALLLIDLDDFKSVNDGHGHHVGDRLLQEVAQRMRAALRAGDALARLGGDEFAVLLRDPADLASPQAVAVKLLAAICRPWRHGHHDASPGASIGVVFAPADGEDADTLMRHADMAMYRAKEAGRGTYAVFDAGMALQIEEKALLQGRLKRAIESDALRLHYQPQLCARSGRVVGVEALLRWKDSELGEVPPARFVAVAESSGLVQSLGEWVVDSACRQIMQWRTQGLALRVAINVSVHQLRQASFAERLLKALAHLQVPPALLELEITETAAMTHVDQTQALLRHLAGHGVQLALDDFGMGYSSLGHLRDMPVSRLKMDRSYIQGITEHAQDAVLARAIIGLAKTLGKIVVAEGVETEAQRTFLQQEGCDELQGWLFGRAVPAEEIPALLARIERQAAQPSLCGFRRRA